MTCARVTSSSTQAAVGTEVGVLGGIEVGATDALANVGTFVGLPVGFGVEGAEVGLVVGAVLGLAEGATVYFVEKTRAIAGSRTALIPKPSGTVRERL